MFRENIVPADYPNFEEFGPTPCSKSDPDVFFPEEFLNLDPKAKPIYSYEKEAKLLCSECPYKMRCLEYALKNQFEQGIWGGTTEYDRKKLRRVARKALRITPSKRK